MCALMCRLSCCTGKLTAVIQAMVGACHSAFVISCLLIDCSSGNKAAVACADRHASGHEHVLQLERSQIIANCINQINSGNFRRPDDDLTALLNEDPNCFQALVARGTCRALAGSTKPSELRKAEADFTKAIRILPDLPDVWKRRSQARAALGDFVGATKDLHDCLTLCDYPC
jgi:hypothetical protein